MRRHIKGESGAEITLHAPVTDDLHAGLAGGEEVTDVGALLVGGHDVVFQNQIGYELDRIDHALVHTIEFGWMADVVEESAIGIGPYHHGPVVAEGIDAELIGDAIAIGVEGQSVSGLYEVIPGSAILRISDAGRIKEFLVVVDNQGGIIDRQAV